MTMKHFNVFVATLVLTCFAMVPAVAKADDDELEDLDVTMQIVDDPEGIDDSGHEMRGP